MKKAYGFDSDSDSDDDDKNKKINKMKHHEFTPAEKEFLDSHFKKSSQRNLVEEMAEVLQVMELDMKEKKYKRDMIQQSYNAIVHPEDVK